MGDKGGGRRQGTWSKEWKREERGGSGDKEGWKGGRGGGRRRR